MSDNQKHAVLSPSGAHRWLACPGSVEMERGKPNTDSVYSKEGTAAHELAALCLMTELSCAAYIGRVMENGIAVTDEMAVDVQKYVDYVNDLVAGTKGTLLVEQRLALTPITGEAEAFGTSDGVILTRDELIVIDLKFGQGEQVEADENPQLMLYAAAALLEFPIAPVSQVRLVIHQPRLNHVSEWAVSMVDLEMWVEYVKRKAYAINLGKAERTPGDKQCRWCKAKADCPELAREVEDSIEMDFASVAQAEYVHVNPQTPLGAKLDAVDLIEDWCRAVRAAVETELKAGNTITGKDGPYKLVQGKQGARAWTDEEEAEAALKAFRLKQEQMYSFKLASPTAIEKLVKTEELGEKRWSKLQSLIVRPKGKLHVAPATDKRPAVVPDVVEFEPVVDSMPDNVI